MKQRNCRIFRGADLFLWRDLTVSVTIPSTLAKRHSGSTACCCSFQQPCVFLHRLRHISRCENGVAKLAMARVPNATGKYSLICTHPPKGFALFVIRWGSKASVTRAKLCGTEESCVAVVATADHLS